MIEVVVGTGRSRDLWVGVATSAILDTSLDLVWVQTATSLDAIDLRATPPRTIPIARGIDDAPPLDIVRASPAGAHVVSAASSCDTGRTLKLEWQARSTVRVLDARDPKWQPLPGAQIVGDAWLSEQLSRPEGLHRRDRRTFSERDAVVPAIAAAVGATCGSDLCARPIPFDGSGIQLVVTAFSEGDCAHYACHLYDPARGRFAPPPNAPNAWHSSAKIEAGSCGPYHFNRAGTHFLAGDRICAVGGRCDALGGVAIGWVDGGVEVGSAG